MQCWTSSQGTSSIQVKYLRACFTASSLRSALIISTNSCCRKWNSRVDLIFRSLLLWSWIQASAAWVCCWAKVCSTLRATRNMSKFVSSPSSGFCLTNFWAIKVNSFNYQNCSQRILDFFFFSNYQCCNVLNVVSDPQGIFLLWFFSTKSSRLSIHHLLMHLQPRLLSVQLFFCSFELHPSHHWWLLLPEILRNEHSGGKGIVPCN